MLIVRQAGHVEPVLATEDGQGLVNALGRLTGADVAASDDLTGSASLDGDWELEYVVGDIEAKGAFSTDLQQEWAHSMALETVRDEFNTGEPGDTDGYRETFESSIVKEIDVFAYTGPPPVGGNIADLDEDGDADQADFGLLQRCLSGPAVWPEPDCAD